MRSKLLVGGLAAVVAFLLATNPLVAHAAAFISSADIINNTIKSGDVKNNSLKGADIKDNKLTGNDVNESTLGVVPNSTNLNGLPASSYLTPSYTAGIANVAGVASFDKLIPASVPAGTYELGLYLTAGLSAAGGFYCAIYTPGGGQDHLDAYGSAYGGVFQTISASRIVTLPANAVLRVFCLTQSGTFTTPASGTYAPAQVRLTRVDSVTSLGTAPKGSDPSGSRPASGAPTR
jgi:hypothetical protein